MFLIVIIRHFIIINHTLPLCYNCVILILHLDPTTIVTTFINLTRLLAACPPTWHSMFDKCVYVSEENSNFDGAVTLCDNLGGELLQWEDADEAEKEYYLPRYL